MNPYEILGVAPDISDRDLASEYKKLAKKYHPDLNPGNAEAAAKMGEINRAYDQIKSMRQRGERYASGGQSYTYTGQRTQQAAYQRAWQTYYKKPQSSPMGMVLAAVVAMLLVRLMVSIMFGGYSNPYYMSGADAAPYGYGAPVYEYYPQEK